MELIIYVHERDAIQIGSGVTCLKFLDQAGGEEHFGSRVSDIKKLKDIVGVSGKGQGRLYCALQHQDASALRSIC